MRMFYGMADDYRFRGRPKRGWLFDAIDRGYRAEVRGEPRNPSNELESEEEESIIPPQPPRPVAPGPPRSRRRYHLTPEGLAAKRANVQRVQPWRASTGPRTEAGKARAKLNPWKHGRRSELGIAHHQWVINTLRCCRVFVWLYVDSMKELGHYVRIQRLRTWEGMADSTDEIDEGADRVCTYLNADGTERKPD